MLWTPESKVSGPLKTKSNKLQKKILHKWIVYDLNRLFLTCISGFPDFCQTTVESFTYIDSPAAFGRGPAARPSLVSIPAF